MSSIMIEVLGVETGWESFQSQPITNVLESHKGTVKVSSNESWNG